MRIDVAASPTVDSPAPATALLQVAVASPAEELLTVISGGSPLEAEEFEVDGARVHRLELAAGRTTVAYTASVVDGGRPRRGPPPAGAAARRGRRGRPPGPPGGAAPSRIGRQIARARPGGAA